MVGNNKICANKHELCYREIEETKVNKNIVNQDDYQSIPRYIFGIKNQKIAATFIRKGSRNLEEVLRGFLFLAMFYIYILHSKSHDKYYIGYTHDYQQRLIQHNTQEYFNTFTSKFRPWLLAAVFECGDSEKEAIRLERFIKKQKSRKLLIQLCDNSFLPDGSLSQLVIPYIRDARAGLIRGSQACPGYPGRGGGAKQDRRSFSTSFLFLEFLRTLLALSRTCTGVVNSLVATFPFSKTIFCMSTFSRALLHASNTVIHF